VIPLPPTVRGLNAFVVKVSTLVLQGPEKRPEGLSQRDLKIVALVMEEGATSQEG
jgi:hypothetical protein